MSIKQFKDERDELLVILMEECGELIQECSKCIRKGDYDSQKFKDELGDVMISQLNSLFEKKENVH